MDKSPHKSAFVNVNGINLHYLDWGGEDDVLLFLAGMGCNAHNYDDLPRALRTNSMCWHSHAAGTENQIILKRATISRP